MRKPTTSSPRDFESGGDILARVIEAKGEHFGRQLEKHSGTKIAHTSCPPQTSAGNSSPR